jgi:hypothetical protein
MSSPDPAKLRRSHPDLAFVTDGDRLQAGLPGQEPVITFNCRESEWIVSTEEWHGHTETFEEAMQLALFVLNGTARTAGEYRGELLASTWLEVFDGESYEMRHTASFLSPFDEDEWTLWPGEKWVVKRLHRRLIEGGDPRAYGDILLGQTQAFDLESDEPTGARAWALDWFDGHYGKPVEGLKWAMDRSHRYVLQIPKGWRDQKEEVPEGVWPGVLFGPFGGEQSLRVRTAFRDVPKKSQTLLESEPIAPLSIEYTYEPVCDHAPEWLLHKWVLTFSNGEEEMMADVGVYQLLTSSLDQEELCTAMDAGVRESRYVMPGR